MTRRGWARLTTAAAAARISAALRRAGIEAVLVGGACVTIYSANRYQSLDLDFVTDEPLSRLTAALAPLGYHRGRGRHFICSGSPWLVDFVPAPVAVGSDAAITRFARRQTRSGLLLLLTPTDCVRDRLAAWYHWHDPQALEQALLVGVRHSLALGVIREWSAREGMADRFAEFRRELARRRVRSRRAIPARRRPRSR